MKYYPEGDPEFYAETIECFRRSKKRSPHLKFSRKEFIAPAWIHQWGDLVGATMPEIEDKHLSMKYRPVNRRKAGAILPLLYRGARAIKITMAEPAGFNCVPPPMTMQEVIASGGSEPDAEPEPQYESYNAMGEDMDPEEERNEEEKPKPPKKPKERDMDCMRLALYDVMDPTYNDPKMQFKLRFEPNVSMLAHLNRNRDRQARACLCHCPPRCCGL